VKSIILGLAFFLCACAHLPPIQPMDAGSRSSMEAQCSSFFPQGRWQLVHTITARLTGGRLATFSGVIALSPRPPSIHCVLMTLEGMVIFEAVDDGRVDVRRAFGPFDNDDFARGVMEDIRLLFIEPDGGILETGAFDQGVLGCRYRTGRGRVVDLIRLADGEWEMHQYGQGGRLLRSVTADAVDNRGIASRMTLDASGSHRYTLSMKLVEAIAQP
jgi:hypothetical protein